MSVLRRVSGTLSTMFSFSIAWQTARKISACLCRSPESALQRWMTHCCSALHCNSGPAARALQVEEAFSPEEPAYVLALDISLGLPRPAFLQTCLKLTRLPAGRPLCWVPVSSLSRQLGGAQVPR